MEGRDSLNLRGLRGLRGHFSAVGHVEKKSLIFKRVGTTPATPATPALRTCSSSFWPSLTHGNIHAFAGAWNIENE